MHFAIRYLTEYRYREPGTDNLNALRVKPATTPVQRVEVSQRPACSVYHCGWRAASNT